MAQLPQAPSQDSVQDERVAFSPSQNKEEEVEEQDQAGVGKGPRVLLVVRKVVQGVSALLACLYSFVIGLALMGDAFKCLGGRGTSNLFSFVDNPVAGLMVGVLATVLVQSSSTSTSIVVGLVGAGQLSLRAGIPVIMGSNIGTSVTNTIVSMGHAGVRSELERSFSAATVHDMFNMLSVIVLLPVELLVASVQGKGGPMYWSAVVLSDAFMSKKGSGATFESPLNAITKPIASLVIENDEHVIQALSVGPPVGRRTDASDVIESACTVVDCTQYFCLSGDTTETWKKISKAAFEALPSCAGHLHGSESMCASKGDGHSGAACILEAAAFYSNHLEQASVISGGLVHGAGTTVGGLLVLSLSLVCLIGGLFMLVKVLHTLVMGSARQVIVRAVNLNDYLAIMVGAFVTMVVQSSSVVTSALTPLAGIGVLSTEKMLPLTLGANIGTTVTGFLAALSVFKTNAIRIALVHLLFNVFGILIWFPLWPMRRVPLGAAKLLGMYASFYRFVPGLYILVAFCAAPGAALAISELFRTSPVGGTLLTTCVLMVLGCFVLWWNVFGGCYTIVSKEQRATRFEDGASAQRREGGDEPVQLGPAERPPSEVSMRV